MNILKGVRESIQVKIVAEVNTDNGLTTRVPFVIKSRKPNHDEQVEVIQKVEAGTMSDDQLIDSFLEGWHGLQGEGGVEVPYNPDNLEHVRQAPEYRSAVIAGLMEAIVGKVALEKNSQRRGGHGR